ncbi:MAG: response regulator [Clostridiaceae bacterium]
MYTLLLVDDEILELETIRDYVDWAALGIKIAGTSKNGRDALAKADELKPDIIITDIKMPIMDGVEFSKKLREFNSTSKLIFLTGYDDFSYVKNAFDVEASNYILKPFSMKDLTESINKAKSELEKDRLASDSIKVFAENKFRSILEGKISDTEDAITSLKKVSEHNFTSCSYILMAAYSDDKILDDLKHAALSIDEYAQVLDYDSFYIILINYELIKDTGIEETASEIQRMVTDTFTSHLDILYSESSLQLPELKNAYDKLISFKDILFYNEKNSIINISKVVKKPEIFIDIPSMEHKITEVLFSYDQEKVEQVINDFFSYITENKLPKNAVFEALFNILLYLWEEFFKFNPDLSAEAPARNVLWNELMECRDIHDAKRLTAEQINNIASHLILKHEDKNQFIIDKIMKFIEKNYSKPITINDVADEVFLSPNYIRNIFKKKTGETFLEYLTTFRMKKAAELLKDKNLKVHEVSNMVGYENVSYFCSIFAKKYLVTPSEYRNKY